MLKPLTVWITPNYGKFLEMEDQIPWNGIAASWETCMQFKKKHSELDMEQWTGFNFKKENAMDIYCHCFFFFFKLICRVHHMKCCIGWLTSWNQYFQEKCQQPQICRWYHFHGRKQRGTKEPLDVSERREWKSWLKTQHSNN